MLPWFSAAQREADLGIADCDSCKARNSRDIRQALACAYEPPARKGMRVMAWDHEGRDTKHDGEEKLCAGYVCRLPEVIEAARARMHWEKGALVSFCGGQQPSDHLLEAIEIFNHSVAELHHWQMTERNKS